jgi:hypothetical protein
MAYGKEERWTDPLWKITENMTNAITRFRKKVGVHDSTRIMSRDSYEYHSKYGFWGSEYGVNDEMYTFLDLQDQALDISHEGKGREELVVLGSGMNQPMFGDDRYQIGMVKHLRQRERKLKTFDDKESYPD